MPNLGSCLVYATYNSSQRRKYAVHGTHTPRPLALERVQVTKYGTSLWLWVALIVCYCLQDVEVSMDKFSCSWSPTVHRCLFHSFSALRNDLKLVQGEHQNSHHVFSHGPLMFPLVPLCISWFPNVPCGSLMLPCGSLCISLLFPNVPCGFLLCLVVPLCTSLGLLYPIP